MIDRAPPYIMGPKPGNKGLAYIEIFKTLLYGSFINDVTQNWPMWRHLWRHLWMIPYLSNEQYFGDKNEGHGQETTEKIGQWHETKGCILLVTCKKNKEWNVMTLIRRGSDFSFFAAFYCYHLGFNAVVSIGLFWFSFMPFLYNGVNYQPFEKNLSFRCLKLHFITLTQCSFVFYT